MTVPRTIRRRFLCCAVGDIPNSKVVDFHILRRLSRKIRDAGTATMPGSECIDRYLVRAFDPVTPRQATSRGGARLYCRRPPLAK